MFHKHDWELITETTTKSKLEVLMESAGEVSIKNYFQIEELSRRKFIQVFKCKHCGKIERYVEDI